VHKIILGLSFLFVLSSSSFAAGNAYVQRLFESANKAYEAGQYDEAISGYERIVGQGIENPDVYYNLANACFRQNSLGRAILYYEKAKQLAPGDEDISANLAFARSRLTDKIPEPAVGFFSQALQKAHEALPLNLNVWIVSLLYFGVCAVVIAAIFLGHAGRVVSIYLGIVFSAALLIFGLSLAVKIHDREKTQYAIVLSPSVEALNEPEGRQTLFSVHEGMKFQVRKTLDEWALVSLPNGMAGWVRASDLGKI